MDKTQETRIDADAKILAKVLSRLQDVERDGYSLVDAMIDVLEDECNFYITKDDPELTKYNVARLWLILQEPDAWGKYEAIADDALLSTFGPHHKSNPVFAEASADHLRVKEQ